MVLVKVPPLPPMPDTHDAHVANLLGRLLEVIRQRLRHEDWGSLRISHFRVLSLVPTTGITITELAPPLFMTKQAAGQFVTQLQESGHVAVRTDEQDRRRRVVVRTPLGEQTISAVNDALREVEQQWAERVGAARYRAFREVLEELTLP